MPNFTQTVNAIRANATSRRNINNVIEVDRELDPQYKVSVRMVNRDTTPRMQVALLGLHNDIRKIPDDILIRYSRALERIRSWENDEMIDFPNLSDI